MKRKISNNLGVSLIEVIAAIMIIAIGMVGVLSLVIQNVQAQYIDKNVLIASGLAQEGLELVRNLRDKNWLVTPARAWDYNLSARNYKVDYSAGLAAVNNITEARLYLDSNGFYTTVVTATPTNFYRLIEIINNSDYLDVKCLIRWAAGDKNHDYTVETYLYNWRQLD